MKRGGICVLSFYSDTSDAESGYRAVRSGGWGRVSLKLVSGATQGSSRTCRRYAKLRLETESLLIVEALPSQLERVATGLRQTGDPAIFLVRDVAVSPAPPLPAEPLDGERLRASIAELARQQGHPAKPHEGHALLSHLRETQARIDTGRGHLMEAVRLGHTVTAAAEWLLDNYHLVRTNASDIRRDLPREYGRILPTLGSGNLRIAEIARELAVRTGYCLSPTTITDALREYQTVEPLNIAELWAFPLMLRLALLEGVARIADGASAAQQMREAAYLWSNRLAAGARSSPDSLARMLDHMEREPVVLQPRFVASLTEQLQGEDDALGPVRLWLEERLQTPVSSVIAAEHGRESAERTSIANAFRTLRGLSQIEFTRVFESVSLVHRELCDDPSGTYGRSDFDTRDRCRRAVESMSRWSRRGEIEVARAAVQTASQQADGEGREVCRYLSGEGRQLFEREIGARPPLRRRLNRTVRRHAAGFYVGSISGLTLAFMCIALLVAWDAGMREWAYLALLVLMAGLPLSELAVQVTNALVISLLPPDKLPKLDFKSGIPEECATLVVIPMMLAGEEVTARELEKLEVRYLANPEPNIWYGLFPDYLDAPTAEQAGDAALLDNARQGIRKLNDRYPGRFVLFHRPRSWSETEQCWIGRERKRGKLEELNALLCGEGAHDILVEGALPRPIRFVITLDADTQLPAGTALRMIETIAHPLNRIQVDAQSRTRLRGFTIIQPRVSITLPSATATRFTRIFSDAKGTDPYCQAVSDAQQDLFGEAIFHGKAIYDVRAFHTILGQRFPSESLLSHDLIEGAHVGVALASDIELFENLPLDYVAFSHRQHRWIRGDWQIAQWATARVPSVDGSLLPNALSLVNRWRIFDNLRRSLVPIACVLLLLVGFFASYAPGVWAIVVASAIAIPALVPVLDRVARRVSGSVLGWRGALDELERAVVLIAVLPHQALVSADAVARVLYRRLVSRRRLLEWQTAEMSGKLAGELSGATMRQLRWIAGGSVLLLMVTLWLHPRLHPLMPFLVLWAGAPFLVVWLGQRLAPRDRRHAVSGANAVFLRGLARRTWRFFDELMNEGNNWLPPDNTQLALRVEVAQRTSPTNIGLGILSYLAAYDLGYVTADGFALRCSRSLASVERMERYEGHLLNWYNTRTLEPLTPRYVSTVDSGNLLASLWVLSQGCEDVARSPLLGPPCMAGVADTLAAVAKECAGDSASEADLLELQRLFRDRLEGRALVARLRQAAVPVQRLAETRDWQARAGEERGYWVLCLSRELAEWTALVDRYLSWMETLMQPPDAQLRVLGEGAVRLRLRATERALSLQELAERSCEPLNALLAMRRTPGMPERISAWLEQVSAQYEAASRQATQTLGILTSIRETSQRLAAAMNMRFLYDEQVRMFGIGYAVGGALEFNSHYDLLASECRLASLVAIAKGDVPLNHWFALGRPRVISPEGNALLSWTGGMFEYLMPLLFTRPFPNSLLDDACSQSVEAQIDYGRQRGIPWGISESAYSALDANRIYQYRAFGVPGLGLKPGLEDDLVVAPYATVLALMLVPNPGVPNLKRLAGAGLAGPMGLYESIDYSRERTPEGELGVVVYAYMAHHQGMSLLAMDNVLRENAMQRRFHADLRIRAVESLLFEQIPLERPELHDIPVSPLTVKTEQESLPETRVFDEDTPLPRVHLQGNGKYSVMTTNSGGGYSRFDGFDVTRWRADATRDDWGSFIYLRDLRTSQAWSATYHPLGGREGTYAVRFSSDRTEYERNAFGIATMTSVTVAPEDDVELRRVVLTNRTLRTRQIELTSYCELALASHNADRAHPAFSKIFVETECLDGRFLIAHRRPRSPADAEIWAAHLLVAEGGPAEYETDRREFIGRGNSSANPSALRSNLSGTVGAVLDPVFSLRYRVALEARARQEVTFVTLAAHSREALLALIARYDGPLAVSRAFELAWTRSQLDFRYLGIGPGEAQRYQELASHLLYPNRRLRAPDDLLARNRLGQEGLWAYGISGDLPILTALIGDPSALSLARELLLAHTYWRLRGLEVDLVFLNQESPSYDRPLRQQLERLAQAHSMHTGIDKPGGVFLRDWQAMSREDSTLVLAASRVVLYGGRGSLQQQLAYAADPSMPPPFETGGWVQEEPSQPLPFLELPYFNGIGGFKADGSEYAIYLRPGSNTPAPWVNVIANARFGTIVRESGLGMTWSGNSQANRLTPWHNDPVSDPPPEIIYIRDEESGAVWSPTSLPVREQDAYRARHGQGYTVFEHNSHALGQELTVFVPAEENGDPVKVSRLRLRNDSSRERRFTVTYFAEWVLRTEREEEQLHVVTNWDAASGALLARNPWNRVYADSVAFAAASPAARSYTGDRAAFIGRNRSLANPAAMLRAGLDNRTGAGLDPAAALQVSVQLAPRAETDVIFLLGQVSSVEEVRSLVPRYRSPREVQLALDTTRRIWEERLGVLTVRTPVLSVDLLLNRWLLYQSLSCRFWGRTATYQSGGAFGFRDQLQDAMALVYALPEVVRAHILTSASRQFPEGDVQHWWHADTGAGVRTRCSDDLVWLPYVVAHYVEVTGDASILDAEASFVEGPALGVNEHEKLFIPSVSVFTAPLREHCRLALEHAWRLGSHELPLMGNGDWNDGMNLVGAGGKGESVWLAWFLAAACERYAALIGGSEAGLAERLRERSEALKTAVDRNAWDGEWYVRAFFDDGQPLGSQADPEAKIDSLAQSWAVIAGSRNRARALQALASARQRLVREDERLVLLFDPPFVNSQPSPGYIMGYPAGVRENGGQYTHGSLWLALAFAMTGDGDTAVSLLQLMNPVENARLPDGVERYHGEPYAVAADVSAAPGRTGRSGWTWYTGSAGWMYRIWIEEVLGIKVRAGALRLSPVIPDDWPGFSLNYRYRTATYEIEVRRSQEDVGREPDGARLVTGAEIQLLDDGQVHRLVVELPAESAGRTQGRDVALEVAP